jgi:cytochrome c biogenesis protein CcmG/thiol:disulfide interchange protein DsbE
MKVFSVVLVCIVAGSCLCLGVTSLLSMQPLETGTTAPEFTLPDISGERVSLSDFEAQVLLLNFWSPTCTPCIQELPVLATLQKEFATEDLAVITICLGCSVKEARQGLKKANTEDILVLLDGGTETMIPYHAGASPTTYLIDRDGVIQLGSAGYSGSTEAYLRSEIERLLEE